MREKMTFLLALTIFMVIFSLSFVSPLESTITSCSEITESGNYTLGSDLQGLPSYDSKCLYIHDVDNVHINCQNHNIADDNFPVQIERVNGFTLESCTLTSSKEGINIPLEIINSHNGKIENNNLIGQYVPVTNSSNIRILNNNFDSVYQQSNSIGNLVEGNNFEAVSLGTQVTAGLIISDHGKNNIIRGNNLNGRSDGVFRGNENSIGADDGIVLHHESDDLVKNNDIKNVWDCGIETLGLISHSDFLDNRITNAGLCGIGAWYWSSWRFNSVEGNTVSNSPGLFYFFRAYGLRQEEDFLYFEDNVFKNNILTEQREGGSSSFNFGPVETTSSIPGERKITSADIKVERNTFSNNDFGLKSPVYFDPQTLVIDGGGNICLNSTEPDYPLECGGESLGSSDDDSDSENQNRSNSSSTEGETKYVQDNSLNEGSNPIILSHESKPISRNFFQKIWDWFKKIFS